LAGAKNFHRLFARVSPVFALLSLALLPAISIAANLATPAAAGTTATAIFSDRDSGGATETPGAEQAEGKRQAASSQFDRAEELRSDLNGTAAEKRTLAQYKQTVSSYRRVYLITPHAMEVPDALLAVAELYSEMGDHFGKNYYQLSVDAYRFLLHEYPASKYGQDAMLRTARLEKDQLGDSTGATKTYEEFLKKYPRGARRREAQEALAEMALLRNSEETVAKKNSDSGESANSTENAEEKTPAKSRKARGDEENASPKSRKSADDSDDFSTKSRGETRGAVRGTDGEKASRASAKSGAEDNAISRTAKTAQSEVEISGPIGEPTVGRPRVRRISSKVTADSTRVTIDLEDNVQFTSGRIGDPDRIFFDLHSARLTPQVAKETIHVEGDLLSAVRVAQNSAGIVRVVLNVNGVKDYTASLAQNPPALVIDLFATAHRETAPMRSASAKAKRGDPKSKSTEAAAAETFSARNNGSEQPAGGSNAGKTSGAALAQNANATKSPNALSAANTANDGPTENLSGLTNSGGAVNPGSSPDSGAAENSRTPANSGTTVNSGSTANTAKSTKIPNPSNSLRSVSTKPTTVPAPSVAQPTRGGQSTLTRALGLKIGRIVIDAGHGGHDTGTVGPTGLMEKDLCLDVALRLSKIIQQRLPGADVILTRTDDTFVPLEERTRIANDVKADLFISIHANSSQDQDARGIETYYLNLKGNAESMEVASRENATSQESIHDLEDLVKKIARSEKIDESREFAQDIQESLAKRIQKTAKPVKDRGVRKAPFLVLIGADMPSILTEISFLSNPSDEQLLKKPEHRQRVAEGLYQGVASYLQNLNSVTSNLPKLPIKGVTGNATAPATTPASAQAALEPSRNQK
jgi:N-acetylmuramoyl-L-alanine amidase